MKTTKACGFDPFEITHPTPESIKQIRDALGFTEGKFADKMGMSRAGLIALETGTAPVRKLHLLAAQAVYVKQTVKASKGSCVRH